MEGKAPLFKLRVTTLGDGTSVVGASFLHTLADGGTLRCCMSVLTSCKLQHEAGLCRVKLILGSGSHHSCRLRLLVALDKLAPLASCMQRKEDFWACLQ